MKDLWTEGFVPCPHIFYSTSNYPETVHVGTSVQGVCTPW